MQREHVLRILDAEGPRLRAEFGVRSLALFGSAARGEATEGSDVDLLVEFEPGPGDIPRPRGHSEYSWPTRRSG